MMDKKSCVSVKEMLRLSSVGVAEKDITWLRVSMTFDSYICVRERNQNKDNEGQVKILSLTNHGCQTQTYPFQPDSAVVSPTDPNNRNNPMLALKVADQFIVVRLGSKGGWRRQFSTTLPDVLHWTWLDQHTIGLVTDKAVFHWLMEEAEVPQKVFSRHQRLDYAEITSYKTDPEKKWCALTGLFPDTSCIVGETQLYSAEKHLSQCIHVHTVLLTSYCFLGNKFPSTVLCAASRDASQSPQGKVHILELGPHVEGNLAPWSYQDVIEFRQIEDRYDFPVSIQVNNLYGLMYVVTKYGQLYVCDLESAACLSSVTVSSEIIFLTAVGSLTQGIICLNTAGQVLNVEVNLHELVEAARSHNRTQNIAERLEKFLPLIPVQYLT